MKFVFVSLLFTLGLPILSNAAPKEKELTKAETYALFCGTAEEALDVLSAYGQLPKNSTKEEVKLVVDDLAERRSMILEIVGKGAPVLKKISDKDGDLAVVLNCSIIDQLGSLIVKKGCYDIKNSTVVRNNGGVEVCKAVAESIKNN